MISEFSLPYLCFRFPTVPSFILFPAISVSLPLSPVPSQQFTQVPPFFHLCSMCSVSFHLSVSSALSVSYNSLICAHVGLHCVPIWIGFFRSCLVNLLFSFLYDFFVVFELPVLNLHSGFRSPTLPDRNYISCFKTDILLWGSVAFGRHRGICMYSHS